MVDGAGGIQRKERLRVEQYMKLWQSVSQVDIYDIMTRETTRVWKYSTVDYQSQNITNEEAKIQD